MKTLHKYCH